MNPTTRREFLKSTGAATAFTAMLDWRTLAADAPAANAHPPWFRRCVRWGQTNLTEIDPAQIDIPWWRAHWKRTRVQGVVVNAGGIVAYYPTAVPHHRRALKLGDRDLFGELTRAAHEDGLAVFARMDSNRADESFYRAQPDWFAHDADGRPYIVTGLYVACVNSPYYTEYLPAILREIATKYRPEGFTDNNWNGPMRNQPCFCAHCEKSFRTRTGAALPRAVNWSDPLYREWIQWNYARRLAVWDHFNRVTREAGGEHCIWVGMMAGSQNWQARVFRDDREIYRRTELIMLDHQRRHDERGFQDNAETGLRLHSAGGWDKLIPESMAMYHLAEHNFRLAAKPEPEVRLWAVSGFAGGIQPWWHHLGAVQEDRRMFRTAEPLWRWHEANEQYLVNRRPVATVGLVWSQRNMDFFGRDDGGAHVDDPWNGWTQALVRARILYVPVHIDDIERVANELGLRALILPNLAAMSDAQVASVRAFVQRGGNLVATGLTSLCNEVGDVRDDFALADLFGARVPPGHAWRDETKRTALARDWRHSYLRLPANGGGRHETLRSFADTDLLAFGGGLEPLTVTARAQVALTFVPPFPVSPPEDVWMREPRTEVPGLIFNNAANGGRIGYLAADLDRRFARDYLPDHGDLLAGLARWSVTNELPLRVEGPGLISCHLYAQPGRLVLHLVNLTNANAWRTPVHELIPVGPFTVTLKLPESFPAQDLFSLTLQQSIASRRIDHTLEFELPEVLDHEVLVLR